MEVVRVFNNELSSLYEVKPPISKAKMTQITKSAIKGIKFYKHIVQSVEKFVQKCRPEYKVPGLYVVDSIVRQSRHQFGADKDVFGPRFVKNINNTFQHLFKCNPDDRSKIIRVLNLWQKNAVFPIDVIQPLLDMGHPNSSTDWPNEPQAEMKESPHKLNDDRHSQNWKGWPQANDESLTVTYAEMSTKNLEKFMKAEMSNAIEEEKEASRFRNQLDKPEENTVKFNKKLLDFDYGDEDEEEMPKNEDNLQSTPNALALSISQNLLSNPDLLRQLQQLSSIQQQQGGDALDTNKSEDFPTSPPHQPPLPAHEAPYMPPPDSDKDDRILPPQDLDERSLAAIMAPHRPTATTIVGSGIACPAEGDRDDRIMPDASVPPRDLDERSLSAILAPIERGILPPLPFNDGSMGPYQNNGQAYQQPPLPLMDPSYPQPPPHLMMKEEGMMYSMPGEPPLPPQDFDERPLIVPPEKERSRSRSGSRSRGRSGRRRSRSKSPRRKRSQSRSRKSSRSEGRERIHEKERERERERERRKKGLPPIKKGCVSVCSTTLWLGHVPKCCTESDISGVFGEFGTVLSIDMIPPRGCAFVVMDRRQDANKAVLKLKNLKLQSSLVKMAWAPGKGVKGKEYKEYWDVSAGVSYVPYEKIPEGSAEALDLLEEGGFIDEESLPDNLKELRSRTDVKSADMSKVDAPFNAMPAVAPPLVPPPPIIPPSTVNLPGMVLPHLMQPQFGLPLPGLLPPQAMVMQVPMGIPPPNPMLMQSQAIMNPMGMPPMIQRAVPNTLQNLKSADVAANSPAGDATPTEEEGTHVTPPVSSSTAVSSTQQTNPVAHFNPIMGHRSMMSVPPPVSSAGAPIPYPPPNVGFSFPPPGMRPPTPQFPSWLQPKPPFADAESRFPRPPFPDAKQEEKKPDDMDTRSSSPTHHDMVISTDDESSMDRDFSHSDPRLAGPTEFPRMPPPHHQRGPPMRFPRAPFPPPRMGRPPPNQHMEVDFPPGPRMRPPMEGRDWYPRDYDGPSFERDNRYDRPRDPWGEPDSKRPMFDREERDGLGERRNSHNYCDDVRSTHKQPDKQKSNSDESKDRSKRKTDKKPSKSLMDDMLKLRFYQRDKNPSYASHLSKKLETKKKETVKPPVGAPVKPEEHAGSGKTNETTAQKAVEEKLPGGKDSRKRSRWGRTLSEEREIQDQKRFEIEIKFQSYEQSSKAALLQQPAECANNDSSVEEGGLDSVSSSSAQMDCLATNSSTTAEVAEDTSKSETSLTDSIPETDIVNNEKSESGANTEIPIETTAVSTAS